MKVSGTAMTRIRISVTLAGLALLAGTTFAQNPPPAASTPPDNSAARESKQATSQTGATPSQQAEVSRVADAYFNFAMGHAAEDEYEITGRTEPRIAR